MKTARFLPLITPLLVFLLTELYFFYPKLIYLVGALIGLLVFFAFWQFSRLSEIDKRWWNYLILPTLITGSVLAYSIFLSSRVLIQLLFVFNLVFLYLYSRQVYYYLLRPASYEVFSIENLSSYLNWLAFFLTAAAIYGLQSFLNLPVAVLMLVMLALVWLLAYQMVWASKIEFSAGLPYVLIGSLILVELAWSLSFLPFNHNVSGLILAICYYVLIGLVKNHLLDKLDAKKVRMYLLVGATSLFALLFTARWL